MSLLSQEEILTKITSVTSDRDMQHTLYEIYDSIRSHAKDKEFMRNVYAIIRRSIYGKTIPRMTFRDDRVPVKHVISFDPTKIN